MELRQIQYFIQLYNDRNITRASKSLFISQQGLSKSIAKLEEELGLVLFERNVQGVVPTQEGEELYGSFEKVMQDYRKLIETADYLKGRRTLSVAAPEGYAMTCDKEEFMRYARENPDIDLVYHEVRNDDIPGILERKEAQAAYMTGLSFPGLVRHATARKEDLCLVMSDNHPLASRDKLELKDIYGCTLLLMDGYGECERWFHEMLDKERIQCRILNRKVSGGLYLHYISDSEILGVCTRAQYRYYQYEGVRWIPLCDRKGEPLCVETALVTAETGDVSQELEDYLEYHKKMFARE